MGRPFPVALAALFALAACNGGAQLSPFERALAEQNLRLADIVYLRDLMEVAEGMSVIHFDRFIEENGMSVRGEGGGSYVYGRDLLRACGPGCSPDEGLGEMLVHFVERQERR